MTVDEYIDYRKNNGPVDKDGYYGYQCMDLYNDYCEKVYNLIGVGADCAKNILNNQIVKDNFEIIENYSDFIPERGDICVWTGSEYGHVGIVECADIECFRCLEQNWKPQQLTEEFHDYFYMKPIYFLKYKNKIENTINKTLDSEEIQKSINNIKTEIQYIENLLRG